MEVTDAYGFQVEEEWQTDNQASYDVGLEAHRAELEEQPAGDASNEDKHDQASSSLAHYLTHNT